MKIPRSRNIVIESDEFGWKEQVEYIQIACQELLTRQHISTTPVFRCLGDNKVGMYLILKHDGSNMIPGQLELAPGWLESCGVFIINIPKAGIFTAQGGLRYYAPYEGIDRDKLQTALMQLLNI